MISLEKVLGIVSDIIHKPSQESLEPQKPFPTTDYADTLRDYLSSRSGVTDGVVAMRGVDGGNIIIDFNHRVIIPDVENYKPTLKITN